MNSYSFNISLVPAPCQYALEKFLITYFHGLSQKMICYFSYDLLLASWYFYHRVDTVFLSEQPQEDCLSSIGIDILCETPLQ